MTEPAGEPAGPVCYRHPDRVTYIRCGHCDQPICTECMIPAPVGFQCPSCVANAEQVHVVTALGAPVISKPYLTYGLIGINVAVFLLQLSIGVDESAANWGMWPIGIAANGDYWSLASSAFLHGSILHIAFNMYVLFVMGPTLERVLGHVRFAVLYLLAALGGAVASYAFSDLNTVSVGASGAIFGLMGAFVVAGRRLRFDITQVLVLLAINLAFGFIQPNVDWRAHIGGLVVGAVVAAIFVFAPKGNQLLWQSLGCIGVLGFLIIATMVRTWQVQDMLVPFVPGLQT
ncbi:MAG: rhomboid family intramembrane serine protease [Actinomycetota bacterium]|nr:rhomboid family intramembrane serine protease [Actinomycetota bacterium]